MHLLKLITAYYDNSQKPTIRTTFSETTKQTAHRKLFLNSLSNSLPAAFVLPFATLDDNKPQWSAKEILISNRLDSPSERKKNSRIPRDRYYSRDFDESQYELDTRIPRALVNSEMARRESRSLPTIAGEIIMRIFFLRLRVNWQRTQRPIDRWMRRPRA